MYARIEPIGENEHRTKSDRYLSIRKNREKENLFDEDSRIHFLVQKMLCLIMFADFALTD